MMVWEKDFPVFFVLESDRMVLEVAIRIYGFHVPEAAVNIGTGIRRVVNNRKDTAVGQGSP